MDKKTSCCPNFDSFAPQPVYMNGKHIGMLMPRADQRTLAASSAIQGWSIPTSEVRYLSTDPSTYATKWKPL